MSKKILFFILTIFFNNSLHSQCTLENGIQYIHRQLVNNDQISIDACIQPTVSFGSMQEVRSMIKNKTNDSLKITFQWEISLSNGQTIRKSISNISGNIFLKPNETLGGHGYLLDADGTTIALFNNKDCPTCTGKTMILKISIIQLSIYNIEALNHLKKAQEYEKSGDLENSKREYQQVLQHDNTNSEAYNKVAEIEKIQSLARLKDYNIQNEVQQEQYNQQLAELQTMQISSMLSLGSLFFQNMGDDDEGNIPVRGRGRISLGFGYLLHTAPLIKNTKTEYYVSYRYSIKGATSKGVKLALSYNNRIEFFAEFFGKYPRMGNYEYTLNADKTGYYFSIGVLRKLDFYGKSNK
jgi:glutaredoxin